MERCSYMHALLFPIQPPLGVNHLNPPPQITRANLVSTNKQTRQIHLPTSLPIYLPTYCTYSTYIPRFNPRPEQNRLSRDK